MAEHFSRSEWALLKHSAWHYVPICADAKQGLYDMPEHTTTSRLTLPPDYIDQPPQVWLDLIGQSYLERGLTKEAIQVLQRNVEAYPTSPTAHRRLGHAYERCGEIELAAMSFQQAAALHTV